MTAGDAELLVAVRAFADAWGLPRRELAAIIAGALELGVNAARLRTQAAALGIGARRARAAAADYSRQVFPAVA